MAYCCAWIICLVPGYLNLNVIIRQFISEYSGMALDSDFLGAVICGWINIIFDFIFGLVAIFFEMHYAIVFISLGIFETGWIIEVNNYRKQLKQLRLEVKQEVFVD